MSTGEKLRAEGRVQGRAEGRVEGLAEGRVEGLAKGRVELLTNLLRRRFGPLADTVIDRLHVASAK